MKNSALLFLMASMFFLISCNSNVVYKKEIDLEKSVFSKNDELQFDFEITDTTARYNVELNVNHSEEYSFQNLYVKIKTVFPDSKSTEDIVSLELSKSGTEWQGKCSGGDCTAPIMLVENTKFQTPGKYQLNISQYGRTDDVEGLNSFKLVVKKVVEKN